MAIIISIVFLFFPHFLQDISFIFGEYVLFVCTYCPGEVSPWPTTPQRLVTVFWLSGGQFGEHRVAAERCGVARSAAVLWPTRS